jgi:Yip1 domain
MSYDPNSGGGTQPTGGNETQPTGDQSMGNQPMGGQPTQPTGDYMPPQGAYTPPPPPQGGYTPPPQGGGYAPPPQGGYTPPQQGGYAPPPQGGYTPPPGGGYTPPPQGGYGAPPPPPGGMGGPAGGPSFNVGNMGTVDQATVRDLFQSYMNAVTKPNVSTYEAEIPRASWLRTLVGLAAVDIVSFLVSLVAAATASAGVNQALSQLHAQGYYGFDGVMSIAGGGGIVGAIIGLLLVPAWFFLGAGILWLTARMFGGTNSNFMTHSYLLSLSYTPLRIIGGVLSIIPILGALVSFVAYLYQLYSAGLALQASQRMQPGRAQLAAFLPLIVGILLGCLCFFVAIALFASALRNS